MSNFWKDKKVLVTGGSGFIGSHLCEMLVKKGGIVSITTRDSSNLENIESIKKEVKIIKANLSDFNSALRVTKNKDVVLNLAAKVAGIQFNINHPATMFSENVIISDNVLKAASRNMVERFLIVSSACVYPRFCTIPTPESEGFLDNPEPTNVGYGWAKRATELMGKFYAQEFGMKVAIARPYNAYGPRDNFDPKTSHVIPALIKRIFDEENPLVVWGSGKQTRSFLYVEDFARGLLEITEKYPNIDPVNLGTKEEITIERLARLLVKLSAKKIKVTFDTKKPDGQPRRNCDIRKAKKLFGYEAKIPLELGLSKTIKWYKQHL